ncbi:MAG: PKD domain-containing protein [Chitinophagaceae bacterium]
MMKYLRSVLVLVSLVMAGAAFAQAPVANFSADNRVSCNPLVVQFTDSSTNSPTSWSWNLGNGTTSTLQNPSTTYSIPGTYTVTLIATNASGSNTKTITGYITILNSPVVDFGANDTTVSCGSKTVTFTDLTVLGIPGTAAYYWDFGDGTFSIVQSPTHTYTTAGTFSVSLVVTNSGGCSKTVIKANYIKVIATPTASFSASNTFSCTAPITVNFTNGSTGAATYAWDFGDGNSSTATSPSHIYVSPGAFVVRLIATDSGGCKDTFAIPSLVQVGVLKAGFSISPTVCQGASVSFSNTSTPATAASVWNFGDGGSSTQRSPAYTFNTAGTFTVKLNASYGGCLDSASTTITVAPKPAVAFVGTPIQACSVPLTTNFTNTTTGATSYAWSFGDGNTSTATNPSNTYVSMGNYNVTLVATSSNGCISTLSKAAYVKVQPMTVSFSGNMILGCAPATGAFTANVGSVFPVSSYIWSFGDVSTGSGLAVNHTYAAAGNYTMKVLVTNSAGCVDSATTTVFVGTKPTTAFTATPDTVCLSTPVIFSNTTTGGNTYLWLFGDGGTSTNSNPSHYYGVPGLFTVKLIADYNGCKDTLVRTNYITAMVPLADFSTSYICSNRKQIFITDKSIGASTHAWNFGDGTTSTAVNPGSHTYASNGTYTISLTVTNTTTGCTHSIYKVITIYDLDPSFGVSGTNLCSPAASYFFALNNTYASYLFDFGDGVTAPYSGVTHYWTTTGVFSAKLIVKDANGCKDSMIKPNYVTIHSPTVAFSNTISQGCDPLSVTFTDLSTAFAGSTITTRKWVFGDGTSLITSATTINHVFAQPGSYSVKLIITETGGCTDSLTKPGLIIVNRPHAAFSVSDSTTCINTAISFINNGIGMLPLSYQWDFGDATNSSALNPSHSYAATGNYTVRLVVTDSVGCKDTLSKPSFINVLGIKASFKSSDTVAFCQPFIVNFTNTSTNGSAFLWDFGNGNTANLASPSATYTSPGTYTVRLIATNINGCKDTAYQSILVNAGPSGTLTYSPNKGCLPLIVTFQSAYTATTPTTLTYDFDNGVTLTTAASSVTYTYNLPGIYIPRLILSNGGGCSTSVFGGDTIVVTGIRGGFAVSPNPGCTNQPVTFLDTTKVNNSSLSSHSWIFGDGTSTFTDTPSHAYATAGTYTAQLIVSTLNGCIDTVNRTVVINTTPTVSATDQVICAGDSARLSASGANTYSWSPSTGLSATNIYNPYAKPSATTSYILTGTSLGCTSKDTVTVTVNPIPNITATGGITICAGGHANLSASGGATYNWSPSTGLSSSTGASVTASPTTTTTYTVTGTSALGCTDTAMLTIFVNPTLNLTITASPSICAGDSVILTAGGASTYSWSPGSGLSSTNTSSVVAKPSVTTIYKMTGISGTCTDSISTIVTVKPLPVITISGIQTICTGTSTVLTASGATTYSWTPATGLTATTGATVTAAPSSTITYAVTGTQTGCSASTTATVTVNPLPIVTASPNTSICTGFSTTLNAYGAATYSWTPTAGLSTTNTASTSASPTVTTNYIVTGTNANGCTDTGLVMVTVNPKPTIYAGPNQVICSGVSTTLNATGGVSYVWTPGATLSCTTCASPVASPTGSTRYTVTGTDANGCTDTSSVLISITPVLVISVSGNLTNCANASTTLTASGATIYSWTPATGLSTTSGSTVTATPASTTTYTITGTQAGCSASTTATVTVNPLPIVTASPNTSICTGFSTTLNAYGAATYSWTPTAGLSSTNTAGTSASPTVTTNYIVTGTNANGCSDTGLVMVTVNPKPTIYAGPNQVICSGVSTTLNATGGVSYVWTPGATLSCTTCASPVASPTGSTRYTVTGTDANGCTDTSSVLISIPPVLVISVSGNLTICTNASTTLTASGATTYSWTPATGLSTTSGSTVTATPASTTTYTITGTQAGCSASTTATVTVNPLPIVTASPNISICTGFSTTLNAYGAATYSWTPTAGLSSTNTASITASPTVTTNYIVTGTDGNGCNDTGLVTVTVNAKPTIYAGANQGVCPGTSITLTATGGTSYVWTPGATLSCTTCASPVATPIVSTRYLVTGTSANGCTDTSSVLVSINPVSVITVSGSSSICANSSTTLTASGATNYSWSPAIGLSATTGATVTAAPTSTTTYTVTGTQIGGCNASTTVTVTVNALPNVTASANASICAGTSTTLNAYGATTYFWTPTVGLSSSNTAITTANPTVTTNYIVTGTDGNGCTDTGLVTVTVKPKPTIYAGPGQGVCPGSSITLTATGGTSYVWTPGATLSCTACTSPVATPIGSTRYSVTGTGGNGCTDTSSVLISINPVPVISVSGNLTICANSSTTLTASGASTYSWSPATGLSCTNCASPTSSPLVTTKYYVSGTSALGCIGQDSITVVVHPLPIITTDTPVTVCLNTPVQLTATGATTYVWSPQNGLSCGTCANPIATPSSTTTYKVIGTDGYGCADFAITKITILPLPVVNAGPDVNICLHTTAQLTALGAISYKWTPSASLSCDTCTTTIASPIVSTIYVVTGLGGNGCYKSDSVAVNINPQPRVNAGPDQTVCFGSTTQLRASGASTYVWTPAATLSCSACVAPVASPINTTNYQVVGTDLNGCMDSDIVQVMVIDRMPVAVDSGGEFCEGGSIQLVASGGDDYTWSPAGSLSCAKCPNPTARPDTTTTYQVIIKQGKCFVDTLYSTVIIHPNPTVNAGPDQNIILGSSAKINTTGTHISTYKWTPPLGLSCSDCATPVVSPPDNQTYTVTVSSDFGCTGFDTIRINVQCDGSQLWLPNTFTPNADGENDFFYPHGKGISEIKRFRVYDRWGQLIFDRTNMPINDKNAGWNGTYKNQQLKPDVYVWVLNAVCSNGTPLEVKGDITLIR